MISQKELINAWEHGFLNKKGRDALIETFRNGVMPLDKARAIFSSIPKNPLIKPKKRGYHKIKGK